MKTKDLFGPGSWFQLGILLLLSNYVPMIAAIIIMLTVQFTFGITYSIAKFAYVAAKSSGTVVEAPVNQSDKRNQIC